MALTDNILAYWNLNNDGSGGVSLVDTSGNSNTLTNNNGVTLGTGIIAGDAVFNGTNGLDLSTNITDGNQNLSVSCWVKTTQDGEIIGQWYAGGKWVIGCSGSDTLASLYNFNGSANVIISSTISDGNWHHVVLTTDGGTGTAYLYVDGVSSSAGEFTYDPTISKSVYIGDVDQPGLSWTGQIDEIGIWSRVLSSEEVGILYNSGNGFDPINALYYNAAVNTDWGTLGNWWNDEAFTSPASALPDSTIQVKIYDDVLENTAGDGVCYCKAAEFYSASFYSPLVLNSTGLVNFNGTGGVFDGTATDGISFHDTCSLGENGFVTGNAMFRDSSTNSFGTVNGNAVFHEASYNYGQINGNAEVYYDGGAGTYPIGGVVDGSVSYLGWPANQDQYFNDDVSGSGAAGNWEDKNNWWADDSFTTRPLNSVGTQELPDVGTNIYLYAAIYAYNTSSAINVNRARFYGSAYLNTPITLNVSVNVYFYNSSGTQAIIYGDCYFYENSYFYTNYGNGIIYGNVYLYDNSGIYEESNAGYNVASGGLYFNSLNAMKNTISYHFGGEADGTVFNIPTSEGSSMISRLLNLPWFINI